MKRIILCEGKTDSVLIGYLLNKPFGWNFITDLKNHPNKLPNLRFDAPNETLNWFSHVEKDRQELAIWSLGSYERLRVGLHDIIDRNTQERTEELRFQKIVIVFDHDDRTQESCLQAVNGWYKNCGIKVETLKTIGDWVEAEVTLKKEPTENYSIQLLAIVLPPSGTGNLETFLLNSMLSVESNLVNEAQNFINSVKIQYLRKVSLQLKAQMGSIFSVLSPDGSFERLNQKILNFPWENIPTITNVYRGLSNL